MSSGGRLRSPRYPPSRAPVSGTSRTSLCFTASCPQTLPACRPGPCSSHPFPPFPVQHPEIAMGPYGPSLPKWTYGRAGQEPPHGLCQKGVAMRDIETPHPRLSPQGSTQ